MENIGFQYECSQNFNQFPSEKKSWQMSHMSNIGNCLN